MHDLATVLAAWGLQGAALTPLHDGLINPTWRVEAEGQIVGALQQLNDKIFKPTVHLDIECVTAHLAAKGMLTPRLRPTLEGKLWHEQHGKVWRILSWVGERTVHRISDPAMAGHGGQLVGRFHAALADLDFQAQHVRPGAHDTDLHMVTAARAVAEHGHHRLHARVEPLVAKLQSEWAGLRERALVDLPRRVIHGDLKISNLRFAGQEAVALIDLDTLAWGDLGVELGDMLRSWCNPAREDATGAARFDLELFEAAMRGYASASGTWGPTAAEWAAVVPSVARICLELSARFAADALQECYFGWDASAWPAAGEHNLARAMGQFRLARSVLAQQAEAEARLDAVLQSV